MAIQTEREILEQAESNRISGLPEGVAGCQGGSSDAGKEGQDGAKQSKVNQWREYFTQQGLSAADIPLALAAHEAVGMTWLFGSWAACYSLEPCKQMTRIASTATITDAVEKAERRIQKWSASLSKVPGLRSADRGRLVISMAESSLVRNVARPVMIPLKLWVAWKAVSMSKTSK